MSGNDNATDAEVVRAQVRRFYARLWEAHDTTAIASVLAPDVSFRGSLGDERRGHEGFADYVAGVHAALAEYRCTIEALVVEPPHAFARMTFSGIHRAPFMGHAPTGNRVSWAGAALFTFEGTLIRDVWVLGDLAALERALAANAG